MKKTLAVAIFATLVLFFEATASANGIITIDSPLSPSEGKEGAEVIIYGHDFGVQNSGSYIKFSNYIDTIIESWLDKEIKFVVPSEIDIINAPKNAVLPIISPLIEKIPRVGEVLNLIIKLAPVSIESEVAGKSDLVQVSVITNDVAHIGGHLAESNEKDFLYIPSDSTPSLQGQVLINVKNWAIDYFDKTKTFFTNYLFGSDEERKIWATNYFNDVIRWDEEYVVKPTAQALGVGFSQNINLSVTNSPTPTVQPQQSQTGNIPQSNSFSVPVSQVPASITQQKPPISSPTQTSSSIAIIPINSITITGNRKGVYDNVPNSQTLLMVADVLPKDATNQNVTWSVISGTGTATIDQSGMLTGTSAGIITVLAKATDSSEIVGTKQITVTPIQQNNPPVPATDAENVAAAQTAVATIKQPWSPVYNSSDNIILALQAIVNKVSTGVTVTIKTTDNPQITIDGAITHPGDQYSNIGVTGNITFTLTKGAKTVNQIISIVIYPPG